MKVTNRMRIDIHIGRDEVLGSWPKPNKKIYMYLLTRNSSWPSQKAKKKDKK
jgi:hypothetical protein